MDTILLDTLKFPVCMPKMTQYFIGWAKHKGTFEFVVKNATAQNRESAVDVEWYVARSKGCIFFDNKESPHVLRCVWMSMGEYFAYTTRWPGSVALPIRKDNQAIADHFIHPE